MSLHFEAYNGVCLCSDFPLLASACRLSSLTHAGSQVTSTSSLHVSSSDPSTMPALTPDE